MFKIKVHATRTGAIYWVGKTRISKHLRGGIHGVLQSDDWTHGEGARLYKTQAQAEKSAEALSKYTSKATFTFEVVSA